MGKKLAELNIKERLFVKALAKGVKKGAAAAEAGYPKSSSAVMASRMLKRDKVIEALKELTEASSREVIEEVVIDKVRLLEMFQNIHDIGVGAKLVKIKVENRDGSSEEKEVPAINLPAAKAALESIGKHIGFFEEDNQQKQVTANEITFIDAKS